MSASVNPWLAASDIRTAATFSCMFFISRGIGKALWHAIGLSLKRGRAMRDFSTSVTGWLFILAALMLWFGWVLLPAHIGTFFQSEDFSAVYQHLGLWIWMYRIHIFGLLVTVMALVALGAVLGDTQARIVAWPGIAVATAGLIVSALATAFYYHHGAWGAIQMAGQSAEKLRSHVDSLRIDTEYITCLVRFGRVFFGLGLAVLAVALLRWKVLPPVIGAGAMLLGLVAVGLTMAFPDNLEFYVPVFHLNSLWLLATGIVAQRCGLRTGPQGQAL